MATATAPASNTEAERIFALLDAANVLGRYAMVTLFADQFAEGIAEYAFRLWASAQQRPIEERINDYSDCTIRTIEIGGEYAQGRVTLNFPSAPKVEVREPVPGIVIAVPLEAVPTVEPINDNTKLDALDDSATRFSLLEID